MGSDVAQPVGIWPIMSFPINFFRAIDDCTYNKMCSDGLDLGFDTRWLFILIELQRFPCILVTLNVNNLLYK